VIEKPKISILFVAHDASSTGAPIVLLHLLNWIKLNTDVGFSVLLLEGGALENKFYNVGKTYGLKSRWKDKFILKKIYKRVFEKDQRNIKVVELSRELKSQKFDIVYLNTVVSLKWAKELKETFKVPIICHVHENQFSIDSCYSDIISDISIANVDQFIAVSASTRKNLINSYKISPEKVSICYEFVPVTEFSKPTVNSSIIKKELGITNEFIVGGSGLTSWRKGIDLFVRLAVELNNLSPNNNIKLIWVGQVDHFFESCFKYEVQRLKIDGKIIFTGTKKDPVNYFQIFDVFALTSREDPFPLVCLETASLGKPLVCFQDSGGMAEFLQKGGGVLVPYGDVQAMAIKILELKENSFLTANLGQESKLQVANFDVNIVAPQIVGVVKSIMKK
jgi:glycosyltransferase involved in cell wall biosynthesis